MDNRLPENKKCRLFYIQLFLNFLKFHITIVKLLNIISRLKYINIVKNIVLIERTHIHALLEVWQLPHNQNFIKRSHFIFPRFLNKCEYRLLVQTLKKILDHVFIGRKINWLMMTFSSVTLGLHKVLFLNVQIKHMSPNSNLLPYDIFPPCKTYRQVSRPLVYLTMAFSLVVVVLNVDDQIFFCCFDNFFVFVSYFLLLYFFCTSSIKKQKIYKYMFCIIQCT